MSFLQVKRRNGSVCLPFLYEASHYEQFHGKSPELFTSIIVQLGIKCCNFTTASATWL